MTPNSRRRVTRALLALGPLLAAGTVVVTVTPANQAGGESYVGAVTDFDLLMLAAGADLGTIHRLGGTDQDPMFEEMAAATRRIHEIGVTPTNAGWLFQPGRWTDHPDYLHAGATRKPPSGPAPVADVAWDVSHFARWPLFLTSHAESAGLDSPDRAYYLSLREGLERQFFDRVVVPPAADFRGFRLTNFMDGRNGLYRWDYPSFPGDGYGPYELSLTLFWGWWTFLDSPRVRTLFADVHRQFPFSPAEIEQYLGPWTDGSVFRDGRFALLARIASRLGAGDAALTDAERRVWREGFRPMLGGTGWAGPRAERVSWDLMVPLHFAFDVPIPEWQGDFAEHFARFAQTDGPNADLLPRLQYLYFATRYVVLARGAGREDLIPTGLVDLLDDQIDRLWHGGEETISHDGWGEPVFTGFKDYLTWKLAGAPR